MEAWEPAQPGLWHWDPGQSPSWLCSRPAISALLIVSTNMCHVPPCEAQGAVHPGPALRGPPPVGSKQVHSSSGLLTEGRPGQAEPMTLELHPRDQETSGPQKGGGWVNLQGVKGPGCGKAGSTTGWRPPRLDWPQSGWGWVRGGGASGGQVWGSSRG